MILTGAELESLVNLQHRSPHQLLGMHPLGDGSGVVVRALVPDAAKIEAIPTHEKNKPKIKLNRLHDSGLFEGTAKVVNRVHAYDLAVKEFRGKLRQQRDS